MKYKIGDELDVLPEKKSVCGNFEDALAKDSTAYIRVTAINNASYNYEILSGTGSLMHICGGCLGDHSVVERSINKINAGNMTLKEKFALAFKSEPEKSFIKAGIMNSDESLTSEGRELWTAWLVRKFGAEFKTDVVDPILAEDAKNN